jgi:zinc protease
MINFQSFMLDNGLPVVVHEDPNCLLATVNVMYQVGSKDEDPEKTGFAHLFEHLMFGGSKHIPAYDEPLQQVGGDNNAYTTPDVTNYYCTLPAANLETAFWLESDRMLSLSFDPQVLAVQQKVVIEEFKETHLNQPYGDAWLKLSELAYTNHPYRWPVIGQKIAHIEQATMEEVRAFFKRFYVPNNAVLVVAGNVQLEQVKRLSKKWFEPIPAGPSYPKSLPQEPIQQAARNLTITGEVPLDAIYKAFHVPGRLSKDFYTVELLCHGLGVGKSSRLYEQLIEKRPYFNTIGAYTTETVDPGLLVIIGRLNEGISFEQAETALDHLLADIQASGLSTQELEKVKNHTESTRVFAAVDLLDRAQELAFATLLGDTNLVNEEAHQIQSVSLADTQRVAGQIFQKTNANTLYYQQRRPS